MNFTFQTARNGFYRSQKTKEWSSRVKRLLYISKYLIILCLSIGYNLFAGCVVGNICTVHNDCESNELCIESQCHPKLGDEHHSTTKESTTIDGGITEQSIIDTQGEVKITRIEGDGTQTAPVYHSGLAKPPNAVEATRRFRSRWMLHGERLDQIESIKLVSQNDPSISFVPQSGLVLEKGETSMKRTLTLPKTLVGGLFLLIGIIGQHSVTLAQIHILQGPKGDVGPQGSKGDAGPQGLPGNGFDSATLSFVSNLKKYTSIDATGNKILFSGADIQIINGQGATNTSNGRGNLIVGYNEASPGGSRTGSHNVVVGSFHNYSSYAGVVAGTTNTISGAYSSVFGGFKNTASNTASSVYGGNGNSATAGFASVFGGYKNTASGESSSVCGGTENLVTGKFASVFGGYKNTASGDVASVSGGNQQSGSTPFSHTSGLNHAASFTIKANTPTPVRLCLANTSVASCAITLPDSGIIMVSVFLIGGNIETHTARVMDAHKNYVWFYNSPNIAYGKYADGDITFSGAAAPGAYGLNNGYVDITATAPRDATLYVTVKYLLTR